MIVDCYNDLVCKIFNFGILSLLAAISSGMVSLLIREWRNAEMKSKYGKIKYACYAVNLSMSVVATFSPLLFLTFRSLYGISFSQLGALLFINFSVQLAVDLVVSFYSHKFNLKTAAQLTPVLTALGLLTYAVVPSIFPDGVYAGLLIGTIIFASSGGLAETLISPIISAIPSENPEREMSKLHSVYAWGVVAVVLITSLFLLLFGKENWQILALLWMIVPCVSCVLFFISDFPPVKTPQRTANVLSLIKQKDFVVCFFCILLGGASECTMSQWSSSYLEYALNIPKIWGDVLGVALFALMLGLGRTLYAKFGGNIYKSLLLSAIGATGCYLVAGFSNIAVIGLIACAMTGFCTAILWPGSLIVAADRFPSSGVAVFALMAAGGDLGGAIGTQLLGSITDLAVKNESFVSLAGSLQMTADRLGMKVGLLCAALFPLLAVILYSNIYRRHKNHKEGSF